MDAGKLELRMIEFLADRLATMGDVDSGLYGFYAADLSPGRLLRGYDVPIADFLINEGRHFGQFIEIGAGIGQLVALLASKGLRAVAVDQDTKRHAATAELFAFLSEAEPSLRGMLSAKLASFPGDPVGEIGRDTVLIFTNVVCVANADADHAKLEQEEHMLQACAGAGGVVMDLVRFTRARATEPLWDELSTRVQSLGFEPPRAIYDWGNSDPANPRSTNAGRICFFRAAG